jgi:hypothetical protein
MWFEDHLPSLLSLVAVVVFIVRLESNSRELARWRTEHAEKMDRGFTKITERLDIQNGRVAKLELAREYERGRDSVTAVEH